MIVDLNVLNHFETNIDCNIAAVLTEAAANAWDADANITSRLVWLLTRACLQNSYRSQISKASRHTKAAKTSTSCHNKLQFTIFFNFIEKCLDKVSFLAEMSVDRTGMTSCPSCGNNHIISLMVKFLNNLSAGISLIS